MSAYFLVGVRREVILALPTVIERAFAVAILGVIFGCGDGGSLAKGPGPELDLQTSCANRAAWRRAGTNDCSTCVAHATVPACTCTSDEPYNGVCNQAVTDRANDSDCTTDLNSCVAACAPNDCACSDACYSDHASCEAATAYVLSCLLDACDSFCN